MTDYSSSGAAWLLILTNIRLVVQLSLCGHLRCSIFFITGPILCSYLCKDELWLVSTPANDGAEWINLCLVMLTLFHYTLFLFVILHFIIVLFSNAFPWHCKGWFSGTNLLCTSFQLLVLHITNSEIDFRFGKPPWSDSFLAWTTSIKCRVQCYTLTGKEFYWLPHCVVLRVSCPIHILCLWWNPLSK